MHVFISKDYKIYKISKINNKINKITISNMGLVRVTIIRAVMML